MMVRIYPKSGIKLERFEFRICTDDYRLQRLTLKWTDSANGGIKKAGCTSYHKVFLHLPTDYETKISGWMVYQDKSSGKINGATPLDENSKVY